MKRTPYKPGEFASLRHPGLGTGVRLENIYRVVCRSKSTGAVKWVDYITNLVPTVGLNDSLDKHLKGSAYTAAWYVGLTGTTPSPAADDDMSSHSGWTEVTAYDEANRPTLTLGTVASGSVDNVGNEAQFTISANSTTIGGAFICSDDTKSGSSGVLYGVGAFSAGDKVLDDNDVLEVTVTCTASAS